LKSIAGLRIGVSNDPDADYGPVVTPSTRRGSNSWIPSPVEEGAEIVVDGRGFTLQGHERASSSARR
jgi:malonate-semialdehyde dehydrogenase (acetylating) / methylmalonate-semialdehyde dehydrogenase